MFWEDVWIGESNLKSLYPRLYDVCLDKSCTIAEAGEWVDDRWEWHIGWRRELRSWEQESLSSLIDLLVCRKQISGEPDTWEWIPEPNKLFAVRSAYKVLLERKLEINADSKNVCRLLWQNFAAPKAQAIAWRALFGRIATPAELRRRGILDNQSDMLCPICKEKAETANHLFLECSRTSFLWRSCLCWLGFAAPLSNNIPGNLLHLCFLGKSKRHRFFLASLWVCILWTIWKARNDIVFNNGVWNHDVLLGEIKSFLWNWGRDKAKLLGISLSFDSWSVDPWPALS